VFYFFIFVPASPAGARFIFLIPADELFFLIF
jgi:hypothetical protein